MSTITDSLDGFVMDYYGRDRIPFAEYAGDGTLILKDQIELDCQFKAKQFTDGETLLICYILPNSIDRIYIEKWKTDPILGDSLRGRTKDSQIFESIGLNNGRCFIQDDPLLVGVIFNPMQIQIGAIEDEPVDSISFGITNFLFKGIPFQHQNYVEFIDLDLKGIKATIFKNKDYDQISAFMKMRDKQHVTCELWATVSNKHEIKTLEDKINELCYILSVGCGSKVQWIFYKVFANGSLKYVRHISVPNKPFNAHIIIDAERHVEDWIKFINAAYPHYETWISLFGEINGKPRINAAIDVFTDARISADFIQTKGIKLAVTMEVIKEMFKEAWMPENKLIKEKKTRKNMEHEIKTALQPILEQYLPEEEIENALGRIYQINNASFETILKVGFTKYPSPDFTKME